MSETNQPNEECVRKGVKVGTLIMGADWPEPQVVTGFDFEGDPTCAREVYEASGVFVVALAPPTTDLDGLPIRSTDQKPRGEKAPLALLPWDVLLACHLAPPFLQKLHDDIGLLPIDRARIASIPCERTTDYLSELLEPEAPALGVDLGDVARVFEYGSTKYAPDNWRSFEWDAASDREYWSAFLRHLLAHSRGEVSDPESGLPHLAHAVCCLLIVAYHEAKS